MDKFLKRYKLLKMTQEAIDYLNRPITKILNSNKKTIHKEKLSSASFTTEFYQNKNKNINFSQILSKLSRNTSQLIL